MDRFKAIDGCLSVGFYVREWQLNSTAESFVHGHCVLLFAQVVIEVLWELCQYTPATAVNL